MSTGNARFANFLKSASAIGEVQSSENQTGVPFLISPDPALPNHFPFRLEVAAKLTAKSGFKGSEQNSNCVIARRGGQSFVRRIVKLERRVGGEFAVVLLEFAGCLGPCGCSKYRQQAKEYREA